MAAALAKFGQRSNMEALATVNAALFLYVENLVGAASDAQDGSGRERRLSRPTPQ